MIKQKIKYIAADGREFEDPVRYNHYEKALASDPNTIGYLVRLLQSIDGFVTGVIIAEHDGHSYSQPFVTACVDDWLKDFVDVETLTQEQRYLDSSTGRCAAVLRRRFAPEDLCQYIILIGKTVDMKDCEVFYNSNQKLWKMLKANLPEKKKLEDLN